MTTVRKILRRKLRIGRDLSRKDKQFIASGRITTLNAIATCFAHQINNPLQIIHNSIDRLSKRIPADEQSMTEDLQKLRTSADRIHELIQHLYRLTKNDSKDRERLSIVDVLLSAYNLFEQQLRSRGIEVEIDQVSEPQSPLFVYGNSVELEQCFINLFANARDALASTKEPKILVSLSRTSKKEATIQ